MDKTTEGHPVSTDEIEGMMRNLCGYALGDPDPLQRYLGLTHQQVLFEGIATALRRERGNALADLAADGTPLATVAEKAKLATPQQVRALVVGAGKTIPKPTRAARGHGVASRSVAETDPPAAAPPAASVGEAGDPGVTMPPGGEDGKDPGRVDKKDVGGGGRKPSARRAALTRGRGTSPAMPRPVPPGGTRTLTADERVALGLPAAGPIPRTSPRVLTTR